MCLARWSTKTKGCSFLHGHFQMNNVAKRIVNKLMVFRFFSIPASVALNNCTGTDGIEQLRELSIQQYLFVCVSVFFPKILRYLHHIFSNAFPYYKKLINKYICPDFL